MTDLTRARGRWLQIWLEHGTLEWLGREADKDGLDVVAYVTAYFEELSGTGLARDEPAARSEGAEHMTPTIYPAALSVGTPEYEAQTLPRLQRQVRAIAAELTDGLATMLLELRDHYESDDDDRWDVLCRDTLGLYASEIELLIELAEEVAATRVALRRAAEARKQAAEGGT